MGKSREDTSLRQRFQFRLVVVLVVMVLYSVLLVTAQENTDAGASASNTNNTNTTSSNDTTTASGSGSGSQNASTTDTGQSDTPLATNNTQSNTNRTSNTQQSGATTVQNTTSDNNTNSQTGGSGSQTVGDGSGSTGQNETQSGDNNSTLPSNSTTGSDANVTSSSTNQTIPIDNNATTTNQNQTAHAENGTSSTGNATSPPPSNETHPAQNETTVSSNGTASGGNSTTTNHNGTDTSRNVTSEANTNGTSPAGNTTVVAPSSNVTTSNSSDEVVLPSNGTTIQNGTDGGQGTGSGGGGGSTNATSVDGNRTTTTNTTTNTITTTPTTGGNGTSGIDCNTICENSDFCENRANSTYTCFCKKGWKGDNCTEDIDECTEGSTSPCTGPNVNCVNNNGSYTCRCKEGYERLSPDTPCREIVILQHNNSKSMRYFGDDEVFGPFSIPGGFQINGKIVVNYYISTNGYITFNLPYNVPTMPDSNSPILTPLSFLAPFWADIDIPQGSATSGLYHVALSLEDTFTDEVTKTLFDMYSAKVTLPADFRPIFISVITWYDVLPYKAEHFANFQTATFQVVMATNGYDIQGQASWRTVWSDKSDLKVQALQHLTPTAVQWSPLSDIPKKISFTSLTSGVTPEPSLAPCVDWLSTKASSLPRGSSSGDCPCSIEQAQQDLMFQMEGGSFVRKLFDTMTGSKRQCNYGLSTSNSMLTISDRFAIPPLFKNTTDTNSVYDGFDQCCKKSNYVLCSRYRQMYPTDTCARYTAPLSALIWGDPHMFTLDGNDYNFNGWGEYVVLRSPDLSTGKLEVQARTQQLANHNVTVFKAFAVKFSNTPAFEVHHTDSYNMKLYVDGVETTNVSSMASDEMAVTVSSTAQDLKIALSSSTTIRIIATEDRLSLMFSSPLSAVNGSVGLLGLIDGNRVNDFQLRNGTTLAANSSVEQLYVFGQSWQIGEGESLFNYTIGGNNFSTYQHPDFVPTFLSSNVEDLLIALNETGQMAVGQELCGTYVACLQDFLITGSNASATETKEFQINVFENTQTLLNKKPPKFIETRPVWFASLGVPIFRQNISVHPEETNASLYPTVTWTVDSSLNYTVDSLGMGVWQVTWFLDEKVRNVTTSSAFMFVATSSVTKMASYYSPDVVLCACAGAITCDFSVLLARLNATQGIDMGGSTLYMTDCMCGPTKGGRFCQDDVNACAACHNTTSCNVINDVVSCSPCPTGYEGNGSKCYEIDECLQPDTCAQICNNTVDSYSCSCNPGYTLVNNRDCIDVNECKDKASFNCSANEFCQNTVGGYECVCRPGFVGADCQQKVEYVYGGNLVFKSLPDRDQGWTDDLKQFNNPAFKALASKVETALKDAFDGQNMSYAAVYVIKFELLQSARRRRSVDSSNNMIQATFQVGTQQPTDDTTLQGALDSGFDSQCIQMQCKYGALLGVDKSSSKFQANYDLCQSDRNNVCHNMSTTCVTDNGKATCQCRQGYKVWPLYDYVCQDVDECAENSTLCGMAGNQSMSCHNTMGSYYCECPPMKRWHPASNMCINVTVPDICSTQKPCGRGATECVNTGDGSGYACRCSAGWSGSVCEVEDDEADKMKLILIVVGSCLGALCLILLIAILIMCLVKSRRSKQSSGRDSIYDVASNIPRPTLKDNSADMKRQDSMHKYTEFRGHNADVENGSSMQRYSNPAYSDDYDMASDRL